MIIIKKINLLLLCFITLFLFSLFNFQYGYDYYWHVKVGENILKYKNLPFIDIYSWYGIQNNLHWISHEWLSEVIIYIYKILFKNYGPIIYTTFIISIISIYIFITNKKIYNQFPFHTIIWGITGCLMLGNKVLPRPHIISYLLFTIVIDTAYSLYRNPNSKKIYFSLIIAILWSNSHGGSSNLIYIVYLIFLFTCILSIKYNSKNNPLKSKKQIYKYIIGIILSIIGICINPHTLTMLIYPYQNITYTKMITCISEWHSLNIISIDGIFYTLFIIICIYLFIKNKDKILLIDILLFIPFTILAIKTSKFIIYLYIICSYFIFNYFNNKNYKINLKLILTTLIIINIFNILNLINIKDNNLPSKEIINYLKDNNTKLYNSYSLGGYLIYNDIKPFIDGRADMYINTIFCDSCDIEKGNNIKLINKYDFDTFLIFNNSKLFNYLNNNNKYILITKDNKYSLFTTKVE